MHEISLVLPQRMHGFLKPSLVAAQMGITPGQLRRIASMAPLPGQKKSTGGQLRWRDCAALRAYFTRRTKKKLASAERTRLKTRTPKPERPEPELVLSRTSKLYRRFTTFHGAINGFLREIDHLHPSEIATLLHDLKRTQTQIDRLIEKLIFIQKVDAGQAGAAIRGLKSEA